MKTANLAAAVSVLLLLASACSDEEPAATTVTSVTEDDEAARIADAEARARAYVDAVNEGRIEEMADIIGTALNERDMRHFEFHATLNSSGIQWNLGECEVDSVSSTIVKIECEHTYTEPVFEAVGAGESVWPFTLVGEQLNADSWIPLGSPFNDALHAYRDYMMMFHPDDYALCDPEQQTGLFSQHGGLARVPECAPMMIKHAEAVVQWIEDGQPTS